MLRVRQLIWLGSDYAYLLVQLSPFSTWYRTVSKYEFQASHQENETQDIQSRESKKEEGLPVYFRSKMWTALHTLKQMVLQRYGWSGVFDRNEDGYWYVDITLAINDTRRFLSDETIADERIGSIRAASFALWGLEAAIREMESKEVKQLNEVFPRKIDVYGSTNENWDYLWAHKPAIVGIDTEGNQQSPPVLLQVATDDYTILEAPRGGTLSRHAKRLLSDDSIIKVFCDNFSHRDKISLGIDKLSMPADLTIGPVVDLEAVAARLLGPVKTPRGLSKIVTMSGLCGNDIKIGKLKG